MDFGPPLTPASQPGWINPSICFCFLLLKPSITIPLEKKLVNNEKNQSCSKLAEMARTLVGKYFWFSCGPYLSKVAEIRESLVGSPLKLAIWLTPYV